MLVSCKKHQIAAQGYGSSRYLTLHYFSMVLSTSSKQSSSERRIPVSSSERQKYKHWEGENWNRYWQSINCLWLYCITLSCETCICECVFTCVQVIVYVYMLKPEDGFYCHYSEAMQAAFWGSGSWMLLILLDCLASPGILLPLPTQN